MALLREPVLRAIIFSVVCRPPCAFIIYGANQSLVRCCKLWSVAVHLCLVLLSVVCGRYFPHHFLYKGLFLSSHFFRIKKKQKW
uniref:Uncharacterized protein n=1 Tax=Ixodes scapularis TaxID=6945 RepID=A0A4D5S1Y0_IXOSC